MPRRTKLIGAVAAAALIGIATIAALAVHRMNAFRVAEVVPGSVYRSSQPRPADLADVAKRLGIREVLNLRGHRSGEGWHVAEVAACLKLGLTHHDVRVKNDDWVAQHEARRYVDVLESAPGPVLLHCKNGSDRSGWGAAVASLLAGAPLAEGLAELSPAHGHLCTPARCYLHRFFTQYEDYLAAAALQHDPATFRRWILESYCPEPYDAAFDLVETPARRRFAAGEPIAFTVGVTNRSHEAWRLSAGRSGVRLGGRLLGPFAEPPADALSTFRTPNNPARDVARTGMEEGNIPPGGEKAFTLGFPAPSAQGHYVLQIDMVDEHVHWFSDLGGPGVLFEFDIGPANAGAG